MCDVFMCIFVCIYMCIYVCMCSLCVSVINSGRGWLSSFFYLRHPSLSHILLFNQFNRSSIAVHQIFTLYISCTDVTNIPLYILLWLHIHTGYVKNPDGIEDYQKLFENENENEDEDEDDCDSENESENQIVDENDCDQNQIVNANNSDYVSGIIIEDENEILTRNVFCESMKKDSIEIQTKKCGNILLDQIDTTKILSHPSMDLSFSFPIEVVSNLKAWLLYNTHLFDIFLQFW